MLTDMTGLGDQHIMICLRSFAIGIAVNPVTICQITLESFGVCHFFLICQKYLIQFRTGTCRIAALLVSMTKEILEYAGKSCYSEGHEVLSIEIRREKMSQSMLSRPCPGQLPSKQPQLTAPIRSVAHCHQLDQWGQSACCTAGCSLLRLSGSPGLAPVGSSTGHEAFSLSQTTFVYKACLILIIQMLRRIKIIGQSQS